MSNGNSVTLIGNVTRDLELRYTQSGQPSVTFGIAVNRRWQNRQTNEWEEATSYFDVVCWRELAEHAAQSLYRGSRVIVVGQLQQRSWEDQDGQKKSKIEISAEEVGPSLRFTSAQLNRTERRTRTNDNSQGYSAPTYGAPTQTPSGPVNEIIPSNYIEEEEPF
ncbi:MULTISPECIES: single-stranded DNA-binding protein [Acidithrix]|uniref:Single-stranded DNA-binding protein n=1 Tax=Acidithrix ferrooxidans TaxID=1280514 RepID=A0A0D8HFS3_9ACTN|nr:MULTISPECIES: single-stranded DNA-binding protein [Acidithrix]KJF16734.1 single-stranded DNA-binding protein [Acidithrix ferrooxidans]CAG4934360.1 unnamed protein product [Acidithrix sp. C25]